MRVSLLLCAISTAFLSPVAARHRVEDVQEYIRVVAFDAETARSRSMVRLGDYLLAATDAGLRPACDPEVQRLLDLRNLKPRVYKRLRAGWDKWVAGHPSIFGPWLDLMEADPSQFQVRVGELSTQPEGVLNLSVSAALSSDKPSNLVELARVYNGLAYAIERSWGERFRGELARQLDTSELELSATPAALRAAAVERVQAAYRAAPDMNPKFDESTAEVMNWFTEPGSPFAFTIEDYEVGGLFPSSVPGGFRGKAEAKLLNPKAKK